MSAHDPRPRGWDLAVLGDPLAYTLSPLLYAVGHRLLGASGSADALRTPTAALAARLSELRDRGYRGANITHPLKQAALGWVDRASERARRSRSVNTVGFEADHTWGDTTDGAGFLDWLVALGRVVARERVVVLGAGGAARSVALALAEAQVGGLQIAARRPDELVAEWSDIPSARLVK
ncbi:MAG: hypothetical protein HOP12_00120, partial [Candidatus Eisenbacteria bacterium]|nr:hypothetical protein [Candidatus Eisenbacteria bacterium]